MGNMAIEAGAVAKNLTLAGVDLFIQSALLIGLRLVAVRLLRKRGAAVESLALRATLLAVLACPLASALLGAADLQWEVGDTDLAVQTRQTVEQLWANEPVLVEIERSSVPLVLSDTDTGGVVPPPPPFQPRSYLWAAGIWLAATTVMLARLLLAHGHLARIRRRAAAAPVRCVELGRELAVWLGVTRVDIKVSPRVQGPCLVGLWRPSIMLPPEDVQDEESLRLVLIHELAHQIRHDTAWNFLCRLARATIFFNPMVWRLTRRLEESGDEVADDFVVEFGRDRQAYAARLLSFAARPLGRFERAAGAGVVAFKSALGRRVQRVLEEGARAVHSAASQKAAAVVAAACAVCVVGLVSVRAAEAGPAPDKLMVAEQTAESEEEVKYLPRFEIPVHPQEAPQVSRMTDESGGELIVTSNTTIIYSSREWDIDHDVVGILDSFELTWSSSDDRPHSGLSSITDRTVLEPSKVRLERITDPPYEQIDYEFLRGLDMQSTEVLLKKVEVGTVMGVRTSEGAYAKVRVKGFIAGEVYSDPEMFRIIDQMAAELGEQRVKEMKKDIRQPKTDPKMEIELEWTLYQRPDQLELGLEEALAEKIGLAIRNDDAAALTALLEEHPEMLKSDKFFESPLMEAVTFGASVDILKVLIDAGADVNQQQEFRGTPLMQAARTGIVEKVKLLLDAGADLHACVPDENTGVLYYAAASGNVELVKFLIEKGARPTEQDISYALVNVAEMKKYERESGGYRVAPEPEKRFAGPYDFEGAVQLLRETDRDTRAPEEPAPAACPTPEEELPEDLVAAGFAMGVPSSKGRTDLNGVVAGFMAQLVEKMLEEGADVDARDDYGQMPMHELGHMVEGRDMPVPPPAKDVERIGKALLAKGADINARDVNGWTPLHNASFYGNTVSYDWLVANGADATLKNSDGLTPPEVGALGWFFVACANGETKNIEQLLAKDSRLANAKCVLGGMSLPMLVSIVEQHSQAGGTNTPPRDTTHSNGWTPLHEAVIWQQEKAVKLLVSKKADLNARESEFGWTPLHTAAWLLTPEMGVALVEAGADVNVANDAGNLPLHNAALIGDLKLVKLLLDKGSSPAAKNRDGGTPLHYAFDEKVAEELIARGANVNEKKSDGRTPLHVVACMYAFDSLEVLLKSGADINARDSNGFTPLHIAARAGARQMETDEVVKFLVSKGADVNAKTNNGLTALDLAKDGPGASEVQKALREHGAK